MNRDLARLEREHDRAPQDLKIALEFARALARAYDRARAFSLLDTLVRTHRDPHALQLRDQLLDQPPWEGNPSLDWLESSGGEVLSLAIDAAERRLAIGRAGGVLQVVDLDQGDAIELTAHRRSVSALHFPPKKDRLVSGGGDGQVRLFDLQARKQIFQLAGTGSRCLAVWADSGGDGFRLEGRWRSERYLRAQGDPQAARETWKFPFLGVPDRTSEQRDHLELRIQERVHELHPDLARGEGFLTLFTGLSFQRPLSEDPRFLVLGSPRGRRWALVIPGGAEVHLIDGSPGDPPEFLMRDARLCIPRGVPENQPAAAALGPLGKTLILGGAGVESDRPQDLLHIFDLTAPGRVLAFSCRERITAVAVAPGGGLVAVGTRQGRVGVVQLLPKRNNPNPVMRGAVIARPPVEGMEDLREGEPPDRSPEDFSLLRVFDRKTFHRNPRATAFAGDALWVFQGKPQHIHKVDRAAPDWPVYGFIQFLDLGTGQWSDYPYHLHADGRVYAYQTVTRWLLGNEVRFEPAPPNAVVPPVPDKPRGRKPTKRQIESILELPLRDRWPAPIGTFVAVRAKDRPQEVWVIDGASLVALAHLEIPAPVAHIAWSPGATRLALSLKNHEVWLYGGRY